MANTAADFIELITAETMVDLEKLRAAATHGIPEEVRGEVWKYLLGVETPNKSNELSKLQAKQNEYRQFDREPVDTQKRVRGEIARYQQRTAAPNLKGSYHSSRANNGSSGGGSQSIAASASFTSSTSSNSFSSTSTSPANGASAAALARANKVKDQAQIMENVLSAFLNHHRDVEYTAGMVHLCGPFFWALSQEMDVYYCFAAMAQRIEEYYAASDLSVRLSRFLMLFRTFMPDLYDHFEEEEVDLKDWATSWFLYFLSRELPLECLLRLWDTYFASEDGLSLHLYLCLAILRSQKENLEDLEQSEIHAVLLRLPFMDMDM
ncbi:hypothetical protein HK101_008087, partial [Irineochytrium annulatum]